MAEGSTRQANLETACGVFRPTTGHYGCLIIMMTQDLTISGRQPAIASCSINHSCMKYNSYISHYLVPIIA